MVRLFEMVFEGVQEDGTANIGLQADAEFVVSIGGEENFQKFINDEKNKELIGDFTIRLLNFAKEINLKELEK